MSIYFKKANQNIAIFLIVIIGIKNLFSALPFKFTKIFIKFYDILDPHTIQLHSILSFLLGVLMLLLAHRLYKRVRMAWVIQIITLTISTILQAIRYHSLTLPIVFIELYVVVVLGLSYKDFSRKADRITVIKALGFIGVSIVLVLVNASIGMLLMKSHFNSVHDIFDAVEYSVKLLVFMDTDVLSISGKIGQIYADSLIFINWTCIISSLFLLLKPLIYNPIISKHDKDKVRHLVMSFGQNPMAYLSLENDKKHFFGSHSEGVCSYQVVSNVFVVCGDIICDEKDSFAFLNEIMEFCNQNGYDIIFLNVTDSFLSLYKMAGFGVIKYGEDACFKLADYNLAGGRVAKVRAAINHANKAGITVTEYKPLESKDSNIEHQFTDISKEWFEHKNSEEMVFMIGGMGLNNPLDRRYFYASDVDGKILGFVVFLPYLSGKGYLADVTRRRNDAPQGVLEKIIYDAFMQMKSEGVVWGNMGLSPLYNVAEGDKATITAKLFNYIYENINKSYDFKALHHAKEKYAPTEWQPRYLAYNPRPFSPNFAYAMVRVQVGKALTKMVISELNKKKD